MVSEIKNNNNLNVCDLTPNHEENTQKAILLKELEDIFADEEGVIDSEVKNNISLIIEDLEEYISEKDTFTGIIQLLIKHANEFGHLQGYAETISSVITYLKTLGILGDVFEFTLKTNLEIAANIIEDCTGAKECLINIFENAPDAILHSPLLKSQLKLDHTQALFEQCSQQHKTVSEMHSVYAEVAQGIFSERPFTQFSQLLKKLNQALESAQSTREIVRLFDNVLKYEREIEFIFKRVHSTLEEKNAQIDLDVFAVQSEMSAGLPLPEQPLWLGTCGQADRHLISNRLWFNQTQEELRQADAQSLQITEALNSYKSVMQQWTEINTEIKKCEDILTEHQLKRDRWIKSIEIVLSALNEENDNKNQNIDKKRLDIVVEHAPHGALAIAQALLSEKCFTSPQSFVKQFFQNWINAGNEGQYAVNQSEWIKAAEDSLNKDQLSKSDFTSSVWHAIDIKNITANDVGVQKVQIVTEILNRNSCPEAAPLNQLLRHMQDRVIKYIALDVLSILSELECLNEEVLKALIEGNNNYIIEYRCLCIRDLQEKYEFWQDLKNDSKIIQNQIIQITLYPEIFFDLLPHDEQMIEKIKSLIVREPEFIFESIIQCCEEGESVRESKEMTVFKIRNMLASHMQQTSRPRYAQGTPRSYDFI